MCQCVFSPALRTYICNRQKENKNAWKGIEKLHRLQKPITGFFRFNQNLLSKYTDNNSANVTNIPYLAEGHLGSFFRGAAITLVLSGSILSLVLCLHSTCYCGGRCMVRLCPPIRINNPRSGPRTYFWPWVFIGMPHVSHYAIYNQRPISANTDEFYGELV